MDSVMMTTPGNGPKLRSRLRSAANAICARSSKNHIHHTFPKISTSSHQNFNRHKAIAFVFSNGNVAKSLSKSGSISTGNLKKSLLASDVNVKTSNSSKEKVSKEDVKDPADSADGISTVRVKCQNRCGRRCFQAKFTREAQEVWCGRVGPRHKRAPADSLQSLFNDLNLYPSKAQVFEMLVIARQSARRVDLTMAFGEFCFLAAQLRKHTLKKTFTPKNDSSNSLPHPDVKNVTCQLDNNCKTLLRSQSDIGSQQQDSQHHPYEVFLGGSCNPTTWRTDVAIPTLEKMGITYFNPQVADWSSELIEIEHRAKQSARVLFFVMDADTRAAAAAVEAAHLAAAPRPLVLVLQPYRRGQRIGGEVVSDQEYLDLSRGQAILQEVAERRNLPVFTELPPALRYTHQLLRGGRPYNPNAITPSVGTHLKKARDAFDAVDEGKTGKLSPIQTMNVLQSYTGVELSLAHVENLIQMLMSQNTTEQSAESSTTNADRNPDVEGQEVTFELFCLLVAEVTEEMDVVNTETMWSPNCECDTPNLDDLEHKIRMLLRWEAKVLLESLAQTSDDGGVRQPSCNVTPAATEQHNDDVLGQTIDEGECTTSNDNRHHARWCTTGSTTKWRHFLQNVHAAISSFVSRIEFNATRSTDDVPGMMGSRRVHNTQSSNTNTTSSSGSSPGRKCNTTYSRRREQEGATSPGGRADGGKGEGGGGLAKGRKLSVIIPKVPIVEVGGTAGSILTPQTTQRLEGLAGSVRDEPLVRDVYLGGSCIVRTSWREDTVIPLLKEHNLTYYKPEMNDYNRIFSAPPYTPANGGKFSFDGLVSNRSSNGLHRQNSNGKNLQRNSSEKTLRLSKGDSFRSTNKHERSPNTIYEGDQPEKKPKYSSPDTSPSEEEDVEVRRKDGPYPLQSDNRLSASDFYKISETATPDPFRGMFDDRQVHGSRVLLFGVTGDTRCLSPMVLASHCIGLRPRAVVLCVQLLKHTDGLSERAVKDYNRGRLYLRDLAERENVPVYETLEEATQCVVRKLKTGDY